jgi:hypothetical protein
MNNVLSRAPFPPAAVPYLIWWPDKAKAPTYRHLVKLQPEMQPQVIHACIAAGHKELFDELLDQVTPTAAHVREAARNWDPHYRKAIDVRLAILGANSRSSGDWRAHISSGFGTSDNTVLKYLDVHVTGNGFEVPYNGMKCDGSALETMVSLPASWGLPPDSELSHHILDYEE